MTALVIVLVFGGVACLTLVPGQAKFLGNMYAFGAMLSFSIAHIALIKLRSDKRDMPWRARGNLR